MTITFKPLHESHFPLLLKWLETPHVKKWWPVTPKLGTSEGGDQDVTYTIELVKEKYSSYVKGYKLEVGAQKPIQAFIIYSDQNPVGYIQIYNAYDFPRSKPLLGLPSNLGAFDIFIGEEEVLKQGLGSKAIFEFLRLHGNQYSYIFADPDSNNLSAIKCYEKAGFKRVTEQQDIGEVWMLKDLSLRNEPLPTIQKLIKERYPDAKAAFWAGSIAANQGTSASDLDLVIVFEEVAHAYREAFIYDGWPIDAFIHDPDTLRYFCGKLEASGGKPALINMILQGQEILAQNSVSIEAKSIAAEALANGPDAWSQQQIDKERFLITDILDDIKSPKNKEEQIISAVRLFEPLLQFYFRTQKKWAASGKSLMRLFKTENPELAEEWTTAFESLVKTGDASSIESAVTKILAPYGGYLWDGFRSDAPADWKRPYEGDSDLKLWGPASYKPLEHMTAKPYHYDRGAERYDEFNENNSRAINALLEKILKEHQVATVLDLTCGTGSQVFWLAEAGFEVVGSDISRSMLKIAKQKAKLKQLKIKFLQGDCRTVHAGQFDAAITIFNAIGHLTREDFKLTIQNINRNLNPGGLYIFDIFNLDYLKAGNNITNITIDWVAESNSHKFRQIQFSTISDDGILASYSTYVHHTGLLHSPRKISTGSGNTLQVYSSTELQEILKENGFVVLAQTDINGEEFSKEASERILTIAKKV